MRHQSRPASQADEVVTFQVDRDRREIQLRHSSLAVTWAWSGDGRIGLRHVEDRVAEQVWTAGAAPSPLYHARVRAEGASGTTLYDAAHVLDPSEIAIQRLPDRTRLTWRLAPREADLAVTWHVEAFTRHSVLRQWFALTNTADREQTFTRLPVLDVVLDGAPPGLVAHHGLDRRSYRGRGGWPDWYTWERRPLDGSRTGRVESGHDREATWLGLTSGEEGEGGPGLFVGWETNARTTCDYGQLHGDGFGAVSCHLAPNYHLPPGATLTGPPGFVGFTRGDLDELSFRCQRFVDDVLAWRADDPAFPFVTFNSWGYGADIDDAGMRRCFDLCRDLGVELFVVDFGWEDPDWNPLPDTFPNGLAPLAEAAHAAGMRFGVHFSFGNLSALSTAYADQPEWGQGPGQWAYHREGNAVYGLDLANPAARAWIVDTLVRVCDEQGIDYFLTDHVLWGNVNHAAVTAYASDDWMTVIDGFDAVLAEFHRRRPDVLLEHCDNGISLPTFKMVQQHVTSIGSDAGGTLYERIHTWRISRVLPPRYLDHYVCDRPTFEEYVGSGLTTYDYRSQMFGGPMILMTALMTMERGSADWTALVDSIALYKRIRHQVLRGKVLHLLEPQPLEQIGRSWDGWDAIGSLDETSGEAVIFAFRVGGATDERAIPLHGLDPASTYRVTFADRPELLTRQGADLLRDGLALTLPLPGTPPDVNSSGMVRASEVIFLSPESATASVEGTA